MITQGQGSPRSIGGSTANSLAEGFVAVRVEGIRELAQTLQELGAKMGEPRALEAAARKAARLIERGYKNKVGNVTGNLGKSVRIKTKTYEAAAVAVVGPWQSGTAGSREGKESGNAAWLVEFGSEARRPGTKGRRTYLNVHQLINGKMRRHSSANDRQFASMSRGYYFVMGSKYEPTRAAGEGKGYPHDFGFTNGKHHPITLHPGETYGAMPAKHPMERTISEQKEAVFATLRNAIQNSLNRLTQ